MDKRGWLLVASLTVVGCGGADGGPIATQPDPTPEAVTAVDSGVDTKADIATARDAGADSQGIDVAPDSGHAEEDTDADTAAVMDGGADAGTDTGPACAPVDKATACANRCGGTVSDGCGHAYSCESYEVCAECSSGSACCTAAGTCGCAYNGSAGTCF